MSLVGRALLLSSLAALAVWGACAVYDSSLLTGAASDAGSDGAVVGTDGDTCKHAFPPPRPVVNNPDGGQIEFMSSVNFIDLGFDAGLSFGFDLDRTCTCPGPESCKPSTGAPPHCDGPGGQDNSGGELFAKLALLSDQFNPTNFNTTIGKGNSTVLVQVRHYNGQPDDDQVELSMFVSDGTWPKDDGGTGPVPKHDGTDTWGVDESSVLGGLAATMPYTSNYLDGNGYVASGVVVANLDFPLQLNATANLSLKGSYVTGILTPQGSGYAISQARIAGRWSTRQLLTSLQSAADPLDKTKFLCGTDPTYQGIKAQICQSADVTTDPQSDNTNAPCDGISIAVGFTAEPAQFAGVESKTKVVPQCGATYTDQCGQ